MESEIQGNVKWYKSIKCVRGRTMVAQLRTKPPGIKRLARERRNYGIWTTLLKAHRDVMAAVDFTTVEVWTKSGLVTFYLLFVMELKTRRVHFAGCTTSPHEEWVKQMARELTNHEDGFLNGKK